MPGGKPLAYPSSDAYVYDGTLAGFFCCVYHCVYARRIPVSIRRQDEPQQSLLPETVIHTDDERAQRVSDSVGLKVCPRALELLETVHFSHMPHKEEAMLRFLLLAYQQGPQAPFMLGHPDVAPLLDAERHLLHEAHLLTGFVRFSDSDGALTATVTPKNFALPFIAPHFIDRYSQENFLIFDKVHKAALVYQDRKPEIIHVDAIEFPEADETELRYRALWKQFYTTIAIEARINPRCRMGHMPKRYWENMLEMQDDLLR